MRPSLAIKTLFRTPGKTLFTFLLITVLTFSLFIQLAEYFKTAAEFEETVDLYQGTGFVEYKPAVYKNAYLRNPLYLKTDPRVDAADPSDASVFRYRPLSAEAVEKISSLPYVTAYKRYMTAGVSDRHMRMPENEACYDYNERIIVEGTLARCDSGSSGYVPGSEFSRYYLRDAKILAGDAKLEDILFVDGTMCFSDENYLTTYLRQYPEKLIEGERYAVVCRFDRRKTNRDGVNETRASLQLYDRLSEHACPAVWNITDAPENYLELPEYAPLRKLVELTKTDLYTFDVVYTDDMTAIRRVYDNTLHMTEGRWLTQEDTETNAKVCVIDRILAIQYNLKLGDKLPLNLGHALFEQFYSLGAIACTEERFAEDWTQDEFEIVGFYTGSTMAKDADAPNWAYSANTVFVPLSSLPLTESELAGHEFAPGEITIRVDNAWDIGPFLEKTAPQLEAMGLTLSFDDGGWMPVLEEYQEAQRLPLIRIILLAFVTVTGLALSVYLFVSRKRKDYAIMRALGTPKDKSARALLVPITVLSLAASLVAVVAGLVYSSVVIGKLFPLPVLICVGGELAFILLFAGLSIWRLSRLPPLLLLQDSRSKAKKARKKQEAETVEGTLYTPSSVKITIEPLPTPKSPASVRFVLRYVWRHIRRQGLKSVLAVLLAALMVGAVVQFTSLRATYNQLRRTMEIPVKFINSMSLPRLQPLVDEGFTKDIYYERTAKISCLAGTEDKKIQLVITSDIDRFLNQEYEIILGDGYTEEDIGKLDHVLVSAVFMEQQGLRPGDCIRFGTKFLFDSIFSVYEKKFLDEEFYSKGLEPPAIDGFPERQELYARYKEDIERDLDQKTDKAEIIGSIRTKRGGYISAAFTAGLDNPDSLVGTYQSMPLIEFTLSDNSRAEELRQRGEEMTFGRKGAFEIDIEALESVIRTSDLLNGLYLPVIVLALLIGAAMCTLLVMQTTKDAAIMRALGTTKRKTRSMLAVEQILLGVMGIIVGICVMLAIKKEAFADIALQSGLFAAAYALVLILGSYASAALATRKNILELLQTKE